MRKLTILSAALLVLVIGAPAAAEPAVVLLTDADGTRRMARVLDVEWVRSPCVSPVGQPPAGSTPVELELAQQGQTQTVRAHRTDDDRLFVPHAGDRGWCEAPGALVTALAEAQPVPGDRVPWLAFILVFGGIGFATVVVALWGAGRGPDASLEELDSEIAGTADPHASH